MAQETSRKTRSGQGRVDPTPSQPQDRRGLLKKYPRKPARPDAGYGWRGRTREARRRAGDERHREQRDQPDYIVCSQANGVLAYDPDGGAIALLVKRPVLGQ